MRKPKFGSIYQRNQKLPDGAVVTLSPWWIKYGKDGRVFRESSRSEKYSDAERPLKIRVGEIAAGRFQGLNPERTTADELLGDVLLDYRVDGKAVRFAASAIDNHLRPHFSGRRASTVSTAGVQKYAGFRRSANQGARPYRGRLGEAKHIPILPAGNGTINRELALLKHAFQLGMKHTPRKVTSVPYIPLLDEDNVRKAFFEHDQFLAVRRALPGCLQPVATFAYYTGCRRGEILNLRLEQVDLKERIVRLEAGTAKNDGARLLPLTEELYEMLAMQRSIRDAKFPNCPWVFFNTSGKRVGRFSRSWKTACIQAGLVNENGGPDRLFHDLRRSGVRNLIRAGVPERVAVRISGHKTRSVFDRYNIVSERDLHEAARRLEVCVQGKENAADGRTLGTLNPPENQDLACNNSKLLN